MKEIKKLMHAKIFVAISICVFTFALLPFNSYAQGDQTSTVEASAKDPDGDVTRDVGNINITTTYDIRAMGVYATAKDGKKAVVTTKDINVNVSNVAWLYGVFATAGTKGIMGTSASSGRIVITTQNIASKDQGINARSLIEGSELSITTNGDIQAGVGVAPSKDGHLPGYGIVASAYSGAKNSIIVNGNVSGIDVGISVMPNDETSKGNVNIEVYGDIVAINEKNGKGLVFNWTSDTADVLVTGTIAGAKYGVNTKTYNQNFYHTEFGENKLTAWRISAPNLVVKQTSDTNFEPDNDFATKINYIIKHDQNVAPKKANGSNLDVSHGYPIAKEGERVIIDAALDGAYIKKVFNAGAQVTQTDENGNYYIIVSRGGGVDLTAEFKDQNPMTLKGRTVKVKAIALSKKAQTRNIAKAIKITNAKGTLSYQKVKGKKKITIEPKTGKITIKKGLKKGKYKVTVNVTALGDANYKPKTESVIFTVNVI